MNNIPQKLTDFLTTLSNRVHPTQVGVMPVNTKAANTSEYLIVVGHQRFNIWQNPNGKWGWEESFGFM